MNPSILLIAFLSVCVPFSSFGAQDDPPLAGPKVTADPAAFSLVRWGYDGRLERLNEPPEVIALDLMDLTESERREVDRIMAERTALFDSIVRSSLMDLQQLEGAVAEGDRATLVRIANAIAARLTPLIKRGTLGSEISAVLDDDKRAMIRRLTIEYNRALMRDEYLAAQHEGRDFNAVEAFARTRGAALERSIEQSLERTLLAEAEEFEQLMQRINFKPETEQMIRVRAEEFMLQTGLNPTQQQKEEFFAEVFLSLDREDRVKAMIAFFQIGRERRMMR